MVTSLKYIPGVCNIGPEEIKRRSRMGSIGLLISVLVIFLLMIFKAPQILRLVVFFPASMSASGFLQAKLHFCSGFGMAGVFNFDKKVGMTEDVEQPEYRAKDKRKALLIIFYSVLIGLSVAIVTEKAF